MPEASQSPHRQWPTQSSWQPLLDAYSEFVRAVEGTFASESVQQRLNHASQEYARAVEEGFAQLDLQLRARSALQEYERTLQDALTPDQARQPVLGACRRYVRELRRAWLDVNPETLDGKLLVEIAQGMMTVGWIASATSSDAVASPEPSAEPVAEPVAEASDPLVWPELRLDSSWESDSFSAPSGSAGLEE